MLKDQNPIFDTQKSIKIDNSLILNFITDVGVNRFSKYFDLKNFSIVCNFKKSGKGFAIVKLYRLFNVDTNEFFVIRFQITIGSKFVTLVVTSADIRTHFGLSLDYKNCNKSIEMISLFQKILTGMEFIQTTLYQKIAMESVHEAAEHKLFWIQNTVDFYNLGSENSDKQRHRFLNQKAMYFQIIGKKVIRHNNNYIVLTLADDLFAKILFIFIYIPKSRRRFVVKFDKELLINSLSEYVNDLTYQMNITKNFRMQNKIQSIEELIIGMGRKKNGMKSQDLQDWVHLLDQQLLWEKKENNAWLFNLGNLFGIVREYISIRIFEAHQILLETYIDGYLNQIDIFKPYAPAIINDLRHFSFFISLTKPQRIIKKNDNINIYNFLRITNFCSENRTDVNGNFFKDLVHLLEEKLLKKISTSEISFHKINLSDFKQKSNENHDQLLRKNGIGYDETNKNRRQLSVRHTYIGEEKCNCKIIPIFSTVFTINPRRIFSIYFNQVSLIIR